MPYFDQSLMFEQDTARYPWASEYLPGHPKYKEFEFENRILQNIDERLFLTRSPENSYGIDYGKGPYLVVFQVGYRIGTYRRVQTIKDPNTGQARPFDNRIIEDMMFRDNEKVPLAEKQAIVEKMFREMRAQVEVEKQKKFETAFEHVESAIKNPQETIPTHVIIPDHIGGRMRRRRSEFNPVPDSKRNDYQTNPPPPAPAQDGL